MESKIVWDDVKTILIGVVTLLAIGITLYYVGHIVVDMTNKGLVKFPIARIVNGEFEGAMWEYIAVGIMSLGFWGMSFIVGTVGVAICVAAVILLCYIVGRAVRGIFNDVLKTLSR